MRISALVNQKFKDYFFPTILMSASASLSLIVDSVIVGNILGSNELAAINLIMPLSLCFTAICALFGIGSSTAISVFKGKMDQKNTNRCLSLSVIAWGFISIITILIGFFASYPISVFLSGSSGLDSIVYDYLKVYLIGSPFTYATLIFPHIIKIDGMPRLSSVSLIVSNSTNLVMDIIYMKFMELGITGAALATITGNLIGTLLLILYFKSKSRTISFIKIKFSDIKLFIDMFKFSISSIFGQGLMFAKIWIFNMLVASAAGQAGLTAFSICTSCLSFVSIFIAGGAQTMIPMIGAFSGADDNTAIKYTLKRAFILVISCCIVLTLLLEMFPEIILNIYGITDSETMAIGKTAVRLFSLAFSFIGFNFMFMYYTQAKKMPKFSMQICAFDGFVFIVPLGIIFSKLLGVNGIWLSYVINGLLVILFIIFKAKYVVKKSDGILYSIFMYKKSNENIFEISVNVSDVSEKNNAINLISEHIGKNDTETIQLFESVFSLSEASYIEKKSNPKQHITDLIVDNNKISFKDAGKDYTLLSDKTLIDRLKTLNKNYEHTSMIGMNYSTLTL